MLGAFFSALPLSAHFFKGMLLKIWYSIVYHERVLTLLLRHRPMDYCCKVSGAGITLLACIVPCVDSAAQAPLDLYTV